jgi:hypothetical protein
MLQTAWLLNSGGSIETTYYWLDNEDYSPVDYERADLLSIRYSRPWGELQGGVGIEIGDDSLGTNISRLSVFMRY